MKVPKVGDVVYGYQDISDRIGELAFLCSTQEHVAYTFPEINKEIKEEKSWNGALTDTIIWKLERIR